MTANLRSELKEAVTAGDRRKLRIAYVGPFEFPEGGACARRVLGIAQSLHHAGHEVLIGCGGRPGLQAAPQTPSRFAVSCLGERPARETHKLIKAIRILTWGKPTMQWLKTWPSPPDAILCAGGHAAYALRLLPWARRMRIPLVFDVVEWFEPSHVPGGRFGPFHLDSELAVQFLHPKAGNIIAISNYLIDYYRAKGCRTIRIPPTLDVQAVPFCSRAESADPVTLAYTGDPGKKDLLADVIEALVRMDLAGDRVRLVIAGPPPEKVLQFPAFVSRGITTLPGCIRAMGRLTSEQAMAVVQRADFTILLRPNQRYANAGFPTKVVESLACGTPVICNITSDLGEYIRDGQEGLICRDHSVEACMQTIERAIRLSVDERNSMRNCARMQAEQSFDYRVYAESLGAFFSETIRAGRG